MLVIIQKGSIKWSHSKRGRRGTHMSVDLAKELHALRVYGCRKAPGDVDDSDCVPPNSRPSVTETGCCEHCPR